jgi:DNA polymerase V
VSTGESTGRRVVPIRVDLSAPGVAGHAGGLAPNPPGAAGPSGSRDAGDACSSGESFALMVLGDSMLPEFAEGEVIVIEPDGLATEGSFVLAWCNDEWIFRQLARDGGRWRLHALNPAYADIEIPDLGAVRGVIIQKSRPGRRRASKRYVA